MLHIYIFISKWLGTTSLRIIAYLPHERRYMHRNYRFTQSLTMMIPSTTCQANADQDIFFSVHFVYCVFALLSHSLPLSFPLYSEIESKSERQEILASIYRRNDYMFLSF